MKQSMKQKMGDVKVRLKDKKEKKEERFGKDLNG